MDNFPLNSRLISTLIITVSFTLLSACGNQPSRGAEESQINSEASPSPLPTLGIEVLEDLPNEARISTGGGGPRANSYWAVWNSCAPDNKAEVAAANGGREAGWILMDDLIEDPGIQVGDYRLESCQDGLFLLESRDRDGNLQDDPVYQLAAQLFTAELNLNAGAETCPIAEEAVIGSHLILSELGFNGSNSYFGELSPQTQSTISTFLELLQVYNTGQLCY